MLYGSSRWCNIWAVLQKVCTVLSYEINCKTLSLWPDYVQIMLKWCSTSSFFRFTWSLLGPLLVQHYSDTIPVINITVNLSLSFDLFLQQEDLKSKPREGKNAIRSVDKHIYIYCFLQRSLAFFIMWLRHGDVKCVCRILATDEKMIFLQQVLQTGSAEYNHHTWS